MSLLWSSRHAYEVAPAWHSSERSRSGTPAYPVLQTADASLQYGQREWSAPENQRIIKILGELFEHPRYSTGRRRTRGTNAPTCAW